MTEALAQAPVSQDAATAVSNVPVKAASPENISTPGEHVSPGVAPTPQSPQDDMPWLMRDKFKGGSIEEVIQNQAKAYPELFNKMGKFWGAPKEGDYDSSAIEEYGITQDDPIFKNLSPVFKEIGISNEGVKRLAAGWQDAIAAMSNEMSENLAKNLTEADAVAVGQVDGWLKETFTVEEQETIKGWTQTPADFKLLNTMRAMFGKTNNVASAAGHYGFASETVASIEAEKIANHSKYVSDMTYRRQLSQRERDARIRESRK